MLDDWQKWLVRWTFARQSDGLWAARDVGAEVPRQSGKNIWLEVVEIAGLFLFGDRLVIHSAHRDDVSHEHFLSIREHIESSDDLMDKMPTWRPNRGFSTSHGFQSVELANGARLLFKARANGSGRGPRPQRIIFDEALVLSTGQLGSAAPGTAAQRNPQMIFASSSPKADSGVLHSLRARALAAEEGDRLFYAAWNNPEGTAPGDREAWYRANPSLGLGRMTETSLLANLRLMDEAEFLREHLGVPDEPPDVSAVVDPDVWSAMVDTKSAIASRACLSFDMSPDRNWAAFGAAGRRADGRVHLEVVDRRPGTEWVLARAQELSELYGPLRVQSGSPAAAMLSKLREVGLEVIEVSKAEHAQAVGQFLDDARAGALRHLGQLSLDSSLRAAVLQVSGDVEVWGRRSSRADICALVAVTLALGGVPLEQEAMPAIY